MIFRATDFRFLRPAALPLVGSVCWTSTPSNGARYYRRMCPRVCSGGWHRLMSTLGAPAVSDQCRVPQVAFGIQATPGCSETGSEPPIVVDLDGTLVATDTLLESVVKTIKRSPTELFRLPFWLLRGRAGFKSAVAARTRIRAHQLPYNQELLAHLRKEKERGRRLVLATAAHESIARSVCEHLGLFSAAIASGENKNLKGHTKLAAIRENLGTEFVYAGDSRADLPIWKAARGAILVGVSPRLARRLRREVQIECEIPAQKPGLQDWLRAIRIHQWTKNLLLFVPLLTSFGFTDPAKLFHVFAAFVLLCITASATYIANDVWDLENDRAHPRKRHRPIASGKLPIAHAVPTALGALTVTFVAGWVISNGLVLMLLSYVFLTSAYSLVFKEYVLLDVFLLALLYSFRIVTGSVAAGVTTSSWLLAFSFFTFLSLALVKRCSELRSLEHIGRPDTSGRDYRVSDLVVLWPMGAASAVSAIVVLGLFISAPETQAHYGSPAVLWLVAVGMMYWLARLWIKTSRGEMPDDPLVFALRDCGSRFVVSAMVLAALAAHYLHLGPP